MKLNMGTCVFTKFSRERYRLDVVIIDGFSPVITIVIIVFLIKIYL